MKVSKIILILFSFTILTYSSIFAQNIHTVSNDIKIPAEYTSINAAIAAAASGDTIYVTPTFREYTDSVVVTKPLVFIGGGWFEKNASYGGKTSMIRALTVPSISGKVAFANLGVSGRLYIRNAKSVIKDFGDIEIRGCFVNRLEFWANDDQKFSNDKLLVRNSDIQAAVFVEWKGVNADGATIEFKNNILGGVVNSNAGTLVFKNNIFAPRSINYCCSFDTVTNAVILNNIFLGDSLNPASIGVDKMYDCLVDHNMAFLTSDEFPTNSTNSQFSNNLNKTDPLFSTGFSNEGRSLPIEESNYSLRSGSPAIGAGLDGVDLGINGGDYPFLHHKYIYPIPRVKSITISNPVIGQDKVLKFTIEADYPTND